MNSPTAVIAEDEPSLREELRGALRRLWPELIIDTTHAEGRAQHYHRVNLAARAVCRSLDPNVSGSGLQIAPYYKACIDQAVAGAVSRLNRPEVSAYFAARHEAAVCAGTRLATQ